MQITHTCPNGHGYRALLMQPGKLSRCPRCDQAELLTLAYGDCQNPPRGCRLLEFKTELIRDFDRREPESFSSRKHQSRKARRP